MAEDNIISNGSTNTLLLLLYVMEMTASNDASQMNDYNTFTIYEELQMDCRIAR